MFKLRQDGGTKLINIQAKSETSKVKWLVDLCIQPDLNTNLALIGRTKGERYRGRPLFHYQELCPQDPVGRLPVLLGVD